MVESPNDSTLVPDGAALSAYQYFENVRNFLVAVEEMALPTFEASDLEQVSFKFFVHMEAFSVTELGICCIQMDNYVFRNVSMANRV